MDLATLKIKVDSTDLGKAQKQLDSFSASVGKASNAAKLKVSVDHTQFGKAAAQLNNFNNVLNKTIPNLKQLQTLTSMRGTLRFNIDTTPLGRAIAQINNLNNVMRAAQANATNLSAVLSRLSTSIATVQPRAQRTAKSIGDTDDGLKALSKTAVLVQGPLGGTAARLVTVATVARDFDSVMSTLIFTGAALATAISTIGISSILLADKFNSLEARTRVMVGGLGNAEATFQNIIAIASKTGASVETVSDVFNRVSLGAKELGKSNAEITKMVELVSELGVVSGASQANQQAGLLQFGQALGQGIVRAEEWNSIMENITALGNEIATGLGKSTAEVRKMVIDGKLLAKDVFEAIEKRTLAIEYKFSQMPRTLQMAMGSLQTEWLKSSKQIQDYLGVQREVVGLIDSMASNMSKFVDVFIKVIPYLGGTVLVLAFTQLTRILAQATVNMVSFATTAVMAQRAAIALGTGLPIAQVSSLTAGVILLKNALLASLPGLLIVGASAVVGAWIDYEVKLKNATEGAEEFRKKLDGMSGSLVAQNNRIITLGKAYDSMVQEGTKSSENQKLLRFGLEETAKQFGTSVERVKELIKQYGGLQDASMALSIEQGRLAKQTEITNRLLEIKELQKSPVGSFRSALGATGASYQDRMDKFLKDFNALDLLFPDFTKRGPKELDWLTKNEPKVKKLAEEAKKLNLELDKLKDKDYIRNEMSRIKAEEALLRVTPKPIAEEMSKKDANAIANFYQDLADKEKDLANRREQFSGKYYLSTRMLLPEIEARNEVESKHLKISAEQNEELIRRLTLLKQQQALEEVNLELAKQKWEQGRGANLDLAKNPSQLAKLKRLAEVEKSLAPKLAMAGFSPTDRKLKIKEVNDEMTKALEKENAIKLKMSAWELDQQQKLIDAQKTRNAETISQASIEFETKKRLATLVDLSKESELEVQRQVILERDQAHQKYLIQMQEQEDKLKAIQAVSGKENWVFDPITGDNVNRKLEETKLRIDLTNESIRAGLDLTTAEIEKQVQLTMATQRHTELLEFQKTKYEGLNNLLSNFGDQFVTEFTNALKTGEFNFRNFASSIIADITRIIIKAEVMSRIFGGTTLSGNNVQGWIPRLLQGGRGLAAAATGGPLGGALGAAMTIGSIGVPRFADGGVADTGPITGTFGERGAEAVMPLTRLPNGKLGVMSASSGGGVVQQNQINVTIQGGAGDSQQNDDLVKKLVPVLQREMRGMVTSEILDQQRKGNTLNPGFSV